jgi:hypothetical protein
MIWIRVDAGGPRMKDDSRTRESSPLDPESGKAPEPFMPHARANQISDLYHRAIALPVEERRAFLNEQCGGDGSLREEVELGRCARK